jgi:hypothetical protein
VVGTIQSRQRETQPTNSASTSVGESCGPPRDRGEQPATSLAGVYWPLQLPKKKRSLHDQGEATPPRTLEQLAAEGRVSLPTRRGPLPEPLKIDGTDPYALSRALDETRGER